MRAAHHTLDSTLTRNDGQPAQNGEDAVLLADVVRAQAEALLAAQEGMVVLLAHQCTVHEIAEELPASGHLVPANAALLRHHVDGGGGGHRARTRLVISPIMRHYRQALLEVGDTRAVRSDHGQRVRGRDEEVIAQDHRAIRITV